jgi:hypothetical protein
MVAAQHSEKFFASMTARNIWINGSMRAGSLVLETTRNGSLVIAQYGSVQDCDGAQLGPLTVQNGRLYVYCNAYARLLVYDKVEQCTQPAMSRPGMELRPQATLPLRPARETTSGQR